MHHSGVRLARREVVDLSSACGLSGLRERRTFMGRMAIELRVLTGLRGR
jgi:hypothetical protein